VTVLRVTPRRDWMYPNSRSPWAAWFRFMKSMSISAQGSTSLAWVCSCNRGLRSASMPAIHIFAGENVCIQAINPMQSSSLLASSAMRRIASALVSTGFHTISAPGLPAASRSATRRHWSATWSRVSWPYRPWLPVRNQTCEGARRIGESDTDVSVLFFRLLPVGILVARVQPVDVDRVDRMHRTPLPGDVHGAGDFFAHRGGLDRRTGVPTDGERSMVGHQHRRGGGVPQGLDDAPTDRVV